MRERPVHKRRGIMLGNGNDHLLWSTRLCSEISVDKTEGQPTRMNAFCWRRSRCKMLGVAFCIMAILTVNFL